MDSLRIIVTGASGLLGREIIKELSDPKNDSMILQGWALTRTGNMCRKVDITEQDEMKKAIDEFKPNVIIHSAAIRAPDVVDRDYEFCKKVNVDASGFLAKLAAEINAYMIYISTDYVFDGTSPPYTEESKSNPLNNYGKLKFEGEQAVQSEMKNCTILRVPLLYGPIEFLGEGAVDQVLKCVLESNKPNKMSDYEKRYPTHVSDVASIIGFILKCYVEDPSKVRGILHWSGDEMMTKYEMAKIMSNSFKLPLDHMIPVKETDSSSAKRPYNAQLSTEKLKRMGASNRFSFKDGCVQSYKKIVEEATK